MTRWKLFLTAVEIFSLFLYYFCGLEGLSVNNLIQINMKTFRKFFCIFLFFFPLVLKAEVKEIPFTLDDRDRIIRTEQKLESLHYEVNTRFDQLFNFLWAIIGIFTAMMVSVFGFAFWDRKFTQAGML